MSDSISNANERPFSSILHEREAGTACDNGLFTVSFQVTEILFLVLTHTKFWKVKILDL